jgi:hypothetical protein
MAIPLAAIAAGAAASEGASVFTALAAAGKSLGSEFGNMKGMVNNAAQSVQGLGAKFQHLADIFSQYTNYINPAAVANLTRAFKDLWAVVGLVTQGITNELTPIIRGFGNALLPIAVKLAPVLATFASSMAGIGQRAIDVFANLLDATMPMVEVAYSFYDMLVSLISVPVLGFFQVLGDVARQVAEALSPLRPIFDATIVIVKGFAETVGVLMAPMGALAEAFLGLFGVVSLDGKTLAKSMITIFQNLAKAVVLATARLMALVGFTDGIKAMIRSIEGAGKSGSQRGNDMGLAVSENPQFKSIENLGKDLILSAFAASAMGTGPQEKKTDNFLAEILEQLKGVTAQNTAAMFETAITNATDTIVKRINEGIMVSLKQAAHDIIAENPAVKLGMFIRQGIGRLGGNRQ